MKNTKSKGLRKEKTKGPMFFVFLERCLAFSYDSYLRGPFKG